MATEPKTIKFQLMLSESEARAIDDWGFANRIRTRAEAIRRLCEIGLLADERMSEVERQSEASEAVLRRILDPLRELERDESAKAANDIAVAALDLLEANMGALHSARSLVEVISQIKSLPAPPDATASDAAIEILERVRRRLQGAPDKKGGE